MFYTTCFRNFGLKNRNISFELPNFMVYKYKIVWSMSYQNVFCNWHIYHVEKLRPAVETLLFSYHKKSRGLNV